jgi:TonB family protein
MRCKIFTLLFALSLGVLPTRVWASGEVEQHLRDQYKGKTLLLRNFYSGNSLRYDASAQLSERAAVGDWTVAAVVRVDDVKVSSHRLTIQAKRVHMGRVRNAGFSPVPTPAGKAGKDYEEARKLRIEADVSPGELISDNAEALLARIFLTSQDRFAELVPDYWKPCVLAGVTNNDLQKYNACHFSADFLDVPGVSYPPRQAPPQPADAVGPGSAAKVFRSGKGVTPPKLFYQQEPGFSEEARQAKYQGTVTLGLVVDRTGRVRDIRIMSPLGCGLDRQAAEVVSTWKFVAGTKDGEPVDVEISVEVDFHLY